MWEGEAGAARGSGRPTVSGGGLGSDVRLRAGLCRAGAEHSLDAASWGPYPHGPTAPPPPTSGTKGCPRVPDPPGESPADPGGLSSREANHPWPRVPGSPGPSRAASRPVLRSLRPGRPACCLRRVCTYSPPSTPLCPSLSCIHVASVQVSVCLCVRVLVHVARGDAGACMPARSPPWGVRGPTG